MKSYARFYPKVLERLQSTPPFASREEAADWLRAEWLAVHIAAGAGKRRLQAIRDAKICAEQGWRFISPSVCYIDSPESPPLRLFLHADGAMVLQRMYTDRNEILFAKPGKLRVVAV